MHIFKGLAYLLMNFVILFVACININGVTNSPAQVRLKVSVVLEQVGFF